MFCKVVNTIYYIEYQIINLYFEDVSRNNFLDKIK